MTPAYIALGSNLRSPRQQLRDAVAALGNLPDSRIDRISSIYRSAAVGPGPQPDYLNAALLLRTALTPMSLLHALQQIEQDQGRERSVRWGPRTLDLDLLLYGDMQIDTARLTVPHPRLQQRNFVLYPLREISDTDLVLPDGTRLDTVIARCPRNDLVKTDWQLNATPSIKDGK